MELTQADKDKAIAWLQNKCGQMRCFCCGMGNWEVLSLATLPIVFDIHTTRFYYSQGIPQIGVACRNCGNTLFFNSALMGFRPDEPPAQPAAE